MHSSLLDNLRDVLGNYKVQYKEHPDYLQLKCLFHDERTPSMFLYPNTNSFFCFGCSKTGPLVNVISKITGVPINKLKNDEAFKEAEPNVKKSNFSKQANCYLSDKIFEVFKKVGPNKKLLEFISDMDSELNKSELGIKESIVFIKKFEKKLYNISIELGI